MSPVYEALGFRFALRSDEAKAFAHLAELFDVFRTGGQAAPVGWYSVLDGSSSAGRFSVLCGDVRLASTDSRAHAVSVLLWDVNRAVTAHASREHAVIHAAAAVRDGVAVLLPAPQEAGKTTTVAGLLGSGFSYLTDEAAAVHPSSSEILPFPKALAIGRGSWQALSSLGYAPGELESEEWHVAPARIGAAVAAPARPGVIVQPRYEPGARTTIERVHRADMLVALATATFHFVDNPGRNLRVLTDLVHGADCYRLTIGDLPRAVSLVESALSAVSGGPTVGDGPTP